MSTLVKAWIDINKIPTEEFKLMDNGDRRYSFMISIEDETKKPFYTNASIYTDQTKDQRDAKEKRFYTGNGKVIWTDGSIIVAEKKPYEEKDLIIKTDEPDPPF